MTASFSEPNWADDLEPQRSPPAPAPTSSGDADDATLQWRQPSGGWRVATRGGGVSPRAALTIVGAVLGVGLLLALIL